MPRRTLTVGPAMAMRNSVAAEGGSSSNSATPPNRNRVMPRIDMPRERATMAYPISCSRMQPKKAKAAIRPMNQYAYGGRAGAASPKYSRIRVGNRLAMLSVSRARIINQLASSEIGIPRSRKSLHRLPNISHLLVLEFLTLGSHLSCRLRPTHLVPAGSLALFPFPVLDSCFQKKEREAVTRRGARRSPATTAHLARSCARIAHLPGERAVSAPYGRGSGDWPASYPIRRSNSWHGNCFLERQSRRASRSRSKNERAGAAP